MKRYNNYHKHDHISNIYSPDTNTHAEEYIKKAVEYGHTNYFTTNHGSMGDIFEAKTICNKYGIRCLAGLEGYIVKNPLEKDKNNYHIIVIPRTDIARKKVNLISSRANVEGYYYKPRLFPEDLIALDQDDVYITSACCAGLLKNEDSIENILMPLINHFGKNVFLEVQNHNVEVQCEINKKALILSKELGLKLIAANDSHYVDEHGQKERLELLKGKHINYGEEDEFILDYPDYDTMFARFEKQGVLSESQIEEAIDNTLIFDECEEIQLDTSIKMPTIYPELSLDERLHLLENMIYERFEKIKVEDNITEEELPRYKEGIEYELQTIRATNNEIRTADYFLFNEKNVDLAVNKYDGVLTRGGRGSAGSFYINRILGMTQLDRFRINLPIFPDRFASAARLLENRAIPDFDFNVSAQEPFVKASRELLGEHGCYPMIAYGTMQLSEAFRNVCRSKGLPHEEYNEIAKNIENYTEDKKWQPIINEAQKYVGTIVSASVHPCAHVLDNVDLREEYGVVRMGDAICVMVTSGEADEYKLLKNDYLIVTVWKLISETFKMIGRPIISSNKLLNAIKDDKRVWDLFKNGLTCTLNQVDSDNGMQQAKKYGISSFEEGAFIAAAIRPSFDSWRDKFLNHAQYSTGSKKLDEVLGMTHGYILFQENLMQYFEWLGVTPAESIGLIKKISKKKIKKEDFQNLEEKLRKNWIEQTGSEDMFDETWSMIQSCIAYGFCSAHAASTSLDMCYGAYLKVNYPLEYYTVCLNNYAGDETRTKKLTKELAYFGITLKPVQFRKSKGDYSCDKETKTIYKGLSSIKFLGGEIADQLHTLGQNKYTSFASLLFDIKEKTNMDSRQLDILIKIDFFSEFGDINKLLHVTERFNQIYGKRSIKKDVAANNKLPEDAIRKFADEESDTRITEIDIDKFLEDRGLSVSDLQDCIKYRYETAEDGTKTKVENGHSFDKIFKKYELTEDEKMKYATKIVYGKFDHIYSKGLLKYLEKNENVKPCSLSQKLKYQLELLGYIDYVDQALDKNLMVITGLDTTYSPKFSGYRLNDGKSADLRVHKSRNPKDKSVKTSFRDVPFENGDIILVKKYEKKPRVKKGQDGSWVEIPGEYHWWLTDYELTNI